MINQRNWLSLQESFLTSAPFNHIAIDDFFEQDVAEQLANEFFPYDSDKWRVHWNNLLENKKLHNVWDLFPATTYRMFNELLCGKWVDSVKQITGNEAVTGDIGLHGGGLHSHCPGGHLNVHLDYNIHPKLNLQRHYNLIIYITPDWQPEWGGGLELWSHNEDGSPKECVKTVENKFNRAVIFDTTQYSWHGLPTNLSCPPGVSRNSFAVYYLSPPPKDPEMRMRARFAPPPGKENDPEILALIKAREDLSEVKKLYDKK
jgi:Rps23 Pro-64 3,4-dihydroxylase Tpa1-like proline 4-hydroxylase